MLGSIIGAGFISGAELVSFFGSENYLLPVAFSTVLITVCFCTVFLVCKEEVNKRITIEKLMGGAGAYRFATCVTSYVFTAGMLASLDALWDSLGILSGVPILSILVMIIISVFSRYGIKGIERINLIIMPFVLIVVNFLLFKKCDLDFNAFGKISVGTPVNVCLYVFMNVFLSIPVMRACSLNKSRKSLMISSVIVAVFIGVQAILILSAIKGANVPQGVNMPFLTAVNSGKISLLLFSTLLVGIITSAFSSYYQAYEISKEKFGLIGVVVSGVFTVSLSMFGLSKIVKYFYPLIGGIGAFFIIRCRKGIKRKINADNKRNHQNSYGGIYVKKEKEQK